MELIVYRPPVEIEEGLDNINIAATPEVLAKEARAPTKIDEKDEMRGESETVILAHAKASLPSLPSDGKDNPTSLQVDGGEMCQERGCGPPKNALAFTKLDSTGTEGEWRNINIEQVGPDGLETTHASSCSPAKGGPTSAQAGKREKLQEGYGPPAPGGWESRGAPAKAFNQDPPSAAASTFDGSEGASTLIAEPRDTDHVKGPERGIALHLNGRSNGKMLPTMNHQDSKAFLDNGEKQAWASSTLVITGAADNSEPASGREDLAASAQVPATLRSNCNDHSASWNSLGADTDWSSRKKSEDGVGEGSNTPGKNTRPNWSSFETNATMANSSRSLFASTQDNDDKGLASGPDCANLGSTSTKANASELLHASTENNADDGWASVVTSLPQESERLGSEVEGPGDIPRTWQQKRPKYEPECKEIDDVVQSMKSILFNLAIRALDMDFPKFDMDSLTLASEVSKYDEWVFHEFYRRNAEGASLSVEDDAAVQAVLAYHPEYAEKIGSGVEYVKISRHSNFQETRCFWIVRKDGSETDFSYHKCLKEKVAREFPFFVEKYDAIYRTRRPRGRITTVEE